MPLIGFDALYKAADSARPRLTVAAAGAADETVLQALGEAQTRGWVEPMLVGEATAIREAAAASRVDIVGFRIVDSSQPAQAAVDEVRSGRAQLLMKGQVDTPTLMRAVLSSETGLRSGRAVCQVVLMEIVDQHR